VRGVVVQVISNITDKPEKIVSKKTKHGFKTIDLFAGVGGIRLGFENAGFKTVFANDFEPQCKDTYDLNFRDSKLVVEDIRKIGIDDLPKFDFLLGGFPCQAFSIAGYRRGFLDTGRGDLFFVIVKILRDKNKEAASLAGRALKNRIDQPAKQAVKTALEDKFLPLDIRNELL